MRKFCQFNLLPLKTRDPRPGRHISNEYSTAKNSFSARRLFNTPYKRWASLRKRCSAKALYPHCICKIVHLAQHRANTGHLQHEPLKRVKAVRTPKQITFVGKIDKNGAALHQRPASILIHYGGYLLLGLMAKSSKLFITQQINRMPRGGANSSNAIDTTPVGVDHV